MSHSAAVAPASLSLDLPFETELVEAALQELPRELRELNRTYLRQVARRSLLTASEIQDWHDHTVTVFLRHDRLRVFAIARGSLVGMADFVTLRDVRFLVNEAGRSQSNAERGPLPNGRSIHAYLTGRMNEASDTGNMADCETWEPIRYLPNEGAAFFRADSGQLIWSSEVVKLTPGPFKIWCPRDCHAVDVGAHAEAGE